MTTLFALLLTLTLSSFTRHAGKTIYSDKGELMAVTRNILTDQLPFKLLLGIKENYKNYWITGLFELSSKEENAYYAIIENATSKLALRSVNNIDWEVYKKTNKN